MAPLLMLRKERAFKPTVEGLFLLIKFSCWLLPLALLFDVVGLDTVEWLLAEEEDSKDLNWGSAPFTLIQLTPIWPISAAESAEPCLDLATRG